MDTCETNKLYKIPFKTCRNYTIDHDLVTIRLDIEWSRKGGDDPELVMDITNKKPVSFIQQNQSSPVFINPVHHHHPQQQQPQHRQENFQSPNQQQHQLYHLSSNNHDLSRSTIISGDHNDVSSTTTSGFHDVTQSHSQLQIQSPVLSTSDLAIQQIKNDLKSQLTPILPRQSTFNPQYLSPQHVIQTPSSNMNDSRIPMPISAISSSSQIKQMASGTMHIHDLRQSPPMSTGQSRGYVICHCSHPGNHEHNCPAITPNKQQSNTNLPSDIMYIPSNNRPIAPRTSFIPQPHSNDTILTPSPKEPIPTTTLFHFPNPNVMKASNLSSDITTIVSQPPQFINNNLACSTIKNPSLTINHNFNPEAFVFPPSMIHSNQSNYQISPSRPMPIVQQQQSIPLQNPPRQRKKPLTKRSPLNNQNQHRPLFPNRNDSSSKVSVINSFNPPIRQPQQNNNHSNYVLYPTQLQPGMFTLQDNSQTSMNSLSSSCNTLHIATNDITGNTTQRRSSHAESVRSPVQLDLLTGQNTVQPSVSTDAIVRTINDVVDGKVAITDNKNTSASTGLQQQQQQQTKPSPFEPKCVWEQNGPVKTKTYLSPLDQKQHLPSYDSNVSTLTNQNVRNITSQIVRSPTLEENGSNTLVQQQVTNTTKKRNRPKPTNNQASKRVCKTTINTTQSTIISTVTSTSTVIEQPILSTPTSISSERITTPHAPNENINSNLSNDLWSTVVDMGQINTLRNSSGTGNASEQILVSDRVYDFEFDEFPSKPNERFNSSTPPLALMSISDPNVLLTSPITEKSSIASIASVPSPDDVYANFFPFNGQPSSGGAAAASQENQVTSSVLTPPDFQSTHVRQSQLHSQNFEYNDSSHQTQTLTSQTIETNSNTVKQMINNPNDSQPTSQPKPKPLPKSNSTNNKPISNSSKISKQQNSTKLTCTRCGVKRLLDITHHELPQQKGLLVYECMSCGNNSLQSNVSPDERKSRLKKVADDHLNRVECQFCHKIFHSHTDYLTHLKNDHESTKPM
ncbi:unnamed protein product [Adineta steineri]|uniref:C2H2-type domain-containing protein n=1 Tax=Adineta steineri TaxID=433720 RepID=A0A815L1F8_9BILA|nr:unnamed protein product [Adineta steineri]CAF3838263.1 unnamed protein product [Adineta steineri]